MDSQQSGPKKERLETSYEAEEDEEEYITQEDVIPVAILTSSGDTELAHAVIDVRSNSPIFPTQMSSSLDATLSDQLQQIISPSPEFLEQSEQKLQSQQVLNEELERLNQIEMNFDNLAISPKKDMENSLEKTVMNPLIIKEELRSYSNKGPAPQPPIRTHERPSSAGEVIERNLAPNQFGGPCGFNQHVCPTALLKSHHNQQSQKLRLLHVGYNTNLREPPENWLRMKRRYHSGPKHSDNKSHGMRGGGGGGHHGMYDHYESHYWSSYSINHDTSMSMFSTLRYGIPSSWRARKNQMSHFHPRLGGMSNFDNSLCMCCVCCNCAKTNQTNCCCCYHCVHTVSSCRRSDLIRQEQREQQMRGLVITAIQTDQIQNEKIDSVPVIELIKAVDVEEIVQEIPTKIVDQVDVEIANTCLE